MSERRLSNYPEMLSGEGVRRVWRAVLTQALEDLANSRYSYDAAQWLYGPASDLAFRCLDVDPATFRARLKETYPPEMEQAA